MDYFIAALVFILGLAVGSFLNVCARRIPNKESIVSPSSHCTSCGSKINAIDNIPVLSYIILGGRCRSCGSTISLKYPLVEIITGALWVAAYYHFGLKTQLLYGLFFVTVLILLSAIDYDTQKIPNKILLPSIGLSLLFLSLYVVRLETPPIIESMDKQWSIAGFFIGGGLLYLIAIMAHLIFKKDAIGGGDIKLASFIGIYLGGYVLLALFISFFLGAVVGIALIASSKKEAKDMIPFGPFMAAGSILTIFFGPQLWVSYLSLSGIS